MSTNFLNTDLFDSSFIIKIEGTKYIPYVPSDSSGVTIASGVDFGQKSPSFIPSMNNKTQQNLLVTACGLKGQSARNWVSSHKLAFGTLSHADYVILMNASFAGIYSSLMNKIDNATYRGLPKALRTVAMDMSYLKPNGNVIISAIPYMIAQNIQAIINIISRSNMSSDRKNKEIKLLNTLTTSSQIGTSTEDRNKKSNYKAITASKSNSVSLEIGNEICLSEYTTAASSFISNICKSANTILTANITDENAKDAAKITDSQVKILVGGLGLEDNDVTNYITKNINFSLTSNQCDAILYGLMNESRSKIKDLFGRDLDTMPKEVNTALISYLLDTNTTDYSTYEDEIAPMITYVKDSKYDDLANYLEKVHDSYQARYKSRRESEAAYIRSRTSDSVDYYSDSNVGNTDNYFSNASSTLNNDLSTAKANYETAKANYDALNASASSDDLDITSQDSNNFANLLEKQQVNTDGFSSSDDSDYTIRLSIKTTFNNETRYKNESYYQVEADHEDDISPILLSNEYKYIPYGTYMYQDTKKNAVNRSKYRIKLYQYQMDKISSKLSGYGISVNITDNDLLMIAAISPAIGLVLVIIRGLLSDYQKYSNLLALEKKNLPNLIKELNRFTRTTKTQ